MIRQLQPILRVTAPIGDVIFLIRQTVVLIAEQLAADQKSVFTILMADCRAKSCLDACRRISTDGDAALFFGRPHRKTTLSRDGRSTVIGDDSRRATAASSTSKGRLCEDIACRRRTQIYPRRAARPCSKTSRSTVTRERSERRCYETRARRIRSPSLTTERPLRASSE